MCSVSLYRGFYAREGKMNLLLSTITDVKGGLYHVFGGRAQRGRGPSSVCIANRHLYSDLSWYRLTNQSTTSEGASVLGGDLKEGQFSHTLQLLLKNVTAQDSGTYRCSVTHLLTGEHTHLDTAVDGHRCVFNSHCAQHKHTAHTHPHTHTHTQTHSCSL